MDDFKVMDRKDVEALRKLLHVAEAGSQALQSWPTYDCDTPERIELTALERSHESLKVAMLYLSEAIYHLTAV